VKAGSRQHGLAIIAVVLAALVGCSARRPSSPARPETPAECDQRKHQLVDFVASLPARSVAAPTRVDLAVSTLGGVPGAGSVLEITAAGAALDGKLLAENDPEARARGLRGRMAAWPPQSILYVAPAGDVDVKTLRGYFAEIPEAIELRLLVRMPGSSSARALDSGTEEARQLAEKVLLEPDPGERRAIADEAYRKLADCRALDEALSGVRPGDRERWPSLQTALTAGLPACDCRKLDTSSLRLLVAAEQRAGAAALAWLPIAFLRDERCGASMPLRSVQKLVRQMEEFDAEFAGGWQKDTLQFAEVVSNDRLGVQFCDALPGETLAAKQRARATLYLRVAGAQGCEALRFEPIAKGSPLGTFHLVSASRRVVAFHYSQAAEEIRVFGPADPEQRTAPTESRDWPCDETFRLVGVDKESIQLERGRFFFTESACERAAGGALGGGCVAAGLAGVTEKNKLGTGEHKSSDAGR
jgi:hypothetical protein